MCPFAIVGLVGLVILLVPATADVLAHQRRK